MLGFRPCDIARAGVVNSPWTPDFTGRQGASVCSPTLSVIPPLYTSTSVDRLTRQRRAVTKLPLLLMIAGGCFAGSAFVLSSRIPWRSTTRWTPPIARAKGTRRRGSTERSASSSQSAPDDCRGSGSNPPTDQSCVRNFARASSLRVVKYTFPESNGDTIARPPWVPVFNLNMVGDGSGGGRTPTGAAGAWVRYVSSTYTFGPEFYVQGRFRLDSDYSTEDETSELQIETDRGFWHLNAAPRSGFWFLRCFENGTDIDPGGRSSGSYTSGDLIRLSVTGTGATQTYKVYVNGTEVYSIAGTGSVPLNPGLRTHDATVYGFAAANTGSILFAALVPGRPAARSTFAGIRNGWRVATTALLGLILFLVIYVTLAARRRPSAP